METWSLKIFEKGRAQLWLPQVLDDSANELDGKETISDKVSDSKELKVYSVSLLSVAAVEIPEWEGIDTGLREGYLCF